MSIESIFKPVCNLHSLPNDGLILITNTYQTSVIICPLLNTNNFDLSSDGNPIFYKNNERMCLVYNNPCEIKLYINNNHTNSIRVSLIECKKSITLKPNTSGYIEGIQLTSNIYENLTIEGISQKITASVGSVFPIQIEEKNLYEFIDDVDPLLYDDPLEIFDDLQLDLYPSLKSLPFTILQSPKDL